MSAELIAARLRFVRARREYDDALAELRRIEASCGDRVFAVSARIAEIVAARRGVAVEQLLGRSRVRNVADARHEAMAIARHCVGLTFRVVGRVFDRTPAAVLWAVRNVMWHCKLYPEYRRDFEGLVAACEAELEKARAS